jgi:hypothetical protein
MQLTQLGVVITALALALAVLVWRGRIRRLNGENPEDRYRRDIHAVRRGRKIRAAERSSGDVWSAGAESDPPQSRAKKATAWVALGSTGGCGGCGGCGCGG